MKITQEERFWRKVQKDETGCWIWTACRVQSKYGLDYGLFYWNGRLMNAHRASWEIHFGPIPVGMHVLHRCDNPPCVRPDHLFLGTNRDNVADKIAKGRQPEGKAAGYHTHRSHENIPKGEKHSFAKMTAEQVRQIPMLRQQGLSQYAIARQFGVSRSSILQILRGQAWKDTVTVKDTGPDTRSKLTAEQRQEIRRLRNEVGLKRHEIAAQFGVSMATVTRTAAE